MHEAHGITEFTRERAARLVLDVCNHDSGTFLDETSHGALADSARTSRDEGGLVRKSPERRAVVVHHVSPVTSCRFKLVGTSSVMTRAGGAVDHEYGERLAAEYRAARLRMTDLANAAQVDDADCAVRACPAWTVRDLFSHVTGIAHDLGLKLVKMDLAKTGLSAFRAVIGGEEHVVGEGEPELTLTASAFETLRTLGSRRTLAEMRRANFDGDLDRHLRSITHMELPEESLGETDETEQSGVSA